MRALSLFCLALPVAAQITPSLELRLETPLTSFSSMAGDPFSAVVIRPLVNEGQLFVPAGSRVYGSVAEAKPVGAGLVRERASLSLNFEELELPSGLRSPIHARLILIDNARETVTQTGLIRGVLAANNPQNFTQGLWRIPSTRMLHRSLLGFTGLTGNIASRVAPGWSVGFMAARGMLTHMPEPEILIPSGTDFRLRLNQLPEFYVPTPETCCVVPDPVADLVSELDPFLDKPRGKPVVDILNVAFLGTREQLDAAFSGAAWLPAQPLTRATFAKAYKAYTTMSGYADAPVSLLQWRGEDPAAVYQKSFNTLSRRHHIRIFPAGEVQGRKLWVGAATHDIGISFEPKSFSFTHRIDLRIDRERAKVATDLTFSGCAEKLGYVERPHLRNANSTGAITDGRVLVLSLEACTPEFTSRFSPLPKVPGNHITRFSRRLLLETRNYLLRGNAYYFVFAVFRDHLLPSRHKKSNHPDD